MVKKKTPQNIVIGGVAGSLPPVIGWAIATNSISLEPISLFLIIFFWTPSHFWAVSLYKTDDYKKAKIPMMPLTDGIEKTKVYIFVYSLLMLPVIILPYIINFSGLVYLIPAMMLTIYYNFMCYDLYKHKKNKFVLKKAKKVFGYSILYLFLIIFFWTPSHFWALSLYKTDDYKKAKIPMMPLTHGIEKTKAYILIYSLLMLPVIILPYAISFSGLIYLIPAMTLTIYYNFICYDLYKHKKNKFVLKKAKKVFGYSILYLFLIFVLFLVDNLI